MKKILVTYKIPKEGLEKLKEKFQITYPKNEFFCKQEIIEQIKDKDAILSIFNMPVDKEIIEAGTNLKIISNYGVGFNNIDIETATNNGIAVCNTPNAVCKPTAELCMGLMLSLSRRIAECNHRLRTENNFKWGVMKNLGSGIYNKTLGIIGMGSIGKEVAKLASVFNMKILYHNRTRLDNDIEKKYNAIYTDLNTLLRGSDIISLHTPLNENTHHLIGSKELKMMKQSAFLINTARGPVVNEDALVKALYNKDIAGAGLDVFENEPIIHKELFKLNNAVIVPHIGTASIDSRIEMGKEASQNIISYFEGNPINIVN